MVPAYVRLLRDNEAEVRIAAAGKVTKFCRILNPELAIQHILPCVKVPMLFRVWKVFSFKMLVYLVLSALNNLLQELSSDSSQHVRSALASVIMGMAPVLGKVRISYIGLALITKVGSLEDLTSISCLVL